MTASVEAPPLLHAEDARIAIDDVVALEHLTVATRGDRVLCVGEVEALFAALTCVPLRARVPAMDPDDLPGEASVMAGALLVAGRDVATHAHLPIAGTAPLDPPLPDGWTAHDYVAWGARLAGMPARAAKDMAATALGRVGLQGAQKRNIQTLDLPQRRALVLAQAIAADPQVVIAEAPASGLDGPAAAFVMAAIAGATQGRGAIVSAHRMDPGTAEGDLARGATHVVVLANGGLVLEGPAGEVFAGARVYGVTVRGNAAAFRDELSARGIEVKGGGMRLSARLPEGATTREILEAARAARAPLVELFPVVG